MKPANPYELCSSDCVSACSCFRGERGCPQHRAWEAGYAAARPTWTRVDLERPETFPEGWIRPTLNPSYVCAIGDAGEVASAKEPRHSVDVLDHGDLWHPLPAPPKDEGG